MVSESSSSNGKRCTEEQEEQGQEEDVEDVEDVEDEDGPTQQHKSTTQYHTLVQLSEPYFLRPNANASNERGECSCGNA